MSLHESLDRDELLYRRISLKNNPPLVDIKDKTILYQAFLPHKKRDIDGLTVIRAKYRSASEVVCPKGAPHSDYVLAVVRAGDLIDLGLTLEITPDEIDCARGGPPAHVSIQQLNAKSYRDDEVLDWARQIAEHHVLDILDPLGNLTDV